jgi:hypothetical protein
MQILNLVCHTCLTSSTVELGSKYMLKLTMLSQVTPTSAQLHTCTTSTSLILTMYTCYYDIAQAFHALREHVEASVAQKREDAAAQKRVAAVAAAMAEAAAEREMLLAAAAAYTAQKAAAAKLAIIAQRTAEVRIASQTTTHACMLLWLDDA